MHIALLLSVFVVASCGLAYELIAGALSSYLIGDSVTQLAAGRLISGRPASHIWRGLQARLQGALVLACSGGLIERQPWMAAAMMMAMPRHIAATTVASA
jgi:hypothetical protein